MQGQQKTAICGQCHYEFELGVQICRGCTGRVVYGATEYEIREARQVGGMMWGGGAFFLVFLLPILLNSEFGWKLPVGWGLGIWGLALAVIAGLWGATSSEAAERADKAGVIRTFPPR